MTERKEGIVRYAILAGIAMCLLGSMTMGSSAEQFLTVPVDLDPYDVIKYFDSQENRDKEWPRYNGHKGTDYRTGEGMPIRAAADGTAYLMKQSENGIIEEGGFGYYVDIKHSNGYWTRYAHLQKDRRKSGAVKRGDVIGYSSNTGAPWDGCYLPHLHFEVRKGGQWGTAVDPYSSTGWLWMGNPPKQFAEVLEPPVLLRYLNYKNLNDPYIDRIYEIREDGDGNLYKYWIIHEQAFKDQWYYSIAKVADVYINPSRSLWKEMTLGENIVFKDGTLIRKSDGTIYEIRSGEKRGFTSWEAFSSRGYTLGMTILVSDKVANAIPTGIVMDYRLLKTAGNPDVYLIQGNEKKLIPDENVFAFWNLNWNRLEVVTQATLNGYVSKGELNYIRYGSFIGRASERVKVYFVSINENGNLVKRWVFNSAMLTYLGGTSGDVHWLSDSEFSLISEGVMYKPTESPNPIIVEPLRNCYDCHTKPTPTPTPEPTPTPSPTPTPTPELKPDLIISKAQIIGETFYISTQNIGDVKSESSWTGFYVNGYLKVRMATGCLNPGEVKRIGYALSVFNLKDRDGIKLLADYQNVIDEKDETNNDLTVVFVEPTPTPTPTPIPTPTPTPTPTPEPTLKPDLTITDIQIIDGNICGSVRNIGNADAESIDVLWNSYEFVARADLIESGVTKLVCFSIPSDIKDGEEIWMVTDFRNYIDEEDETNNDLTIVYKKPPTPTPTPTPSPTPTPDPEPTPTPTADIYVPDDYPTIQLAVDAANEGDTIIVREGTYVENVGINKRLTLIGEGEVTVQSDRTYVFLTTADYTNISGFDVSGARIGVYLLKSDSSKIENIKTSGNKYGIYLSYSDGGVIKNNVVKKNEYGIYLCYSDGNIVTGNVIDDNSKRGVYFTYCSSNNEVSGNTVSNNVHGVYLYKSASNDIFHNNLFDNARNAYECACGAPGNSWDNGAEGNYWDDYTGVDADSNGIGDTPYSNIGSSNKDNYPLMEPREN